MKRHIRFRLRNRSSTMVEEFLADEREANRIASEIPREKVAELYHNLVYERKDPEGNKLNDTTRFLLVCALELRSSRKELARYERCVINGDTPEQFEYWWQSLCANE